MLKVYYSRKYSGFIAAGCLLLSIWITFSLLNTKAHIPLFMELIFCFFVVLMLIGGIIGLLLLRNPPLMFSADHQGVMIYYESKRNRYTKNGVFLPWAIVNKLTLESIVVGVNPQSVTWAIVCSLNEPAPFPVREHRSVWSNSWDELTFSLDAMIGTISKQELLDKLIPLWKSSTKR